MSFGLEAGRKVIHTNFGIVRISPTSINTQRLLLIALVTFVFWNGLWGGAPRADQIAYLHQISQYSSLWDILINSPSWNRTHVTDPILFRPVLYLQLGLFYYLFGYNFFLWQFASLVIHIIVVLGVYALFIRGSLKASIYPFLIAALFGCSFIGSELVLWNHISGYITFSALIIYSVLFLLQFRRSGRKLHGGVALLLGGLAEFTYELGLVFNVLVAVTLLYVYLKKAEGEKPRERICLKFSLLFLAAAILYPLLSVMDILVRDAKIVYGSHGYTPFDGLRAAWYAVKQIVFWLGGFVFSSAYDIHASDRTSFLGFHFSGREVVANCIAVIGIALIVVTRLGQERFSYLKDRKNNLLLALCAMVFAYGYSLIIAYGRALPRGLGYVFDSNTYYAYIACLIAVVAFSFFFLPERNKNECFSLAGSSAGPLTKGQTGKLHGYILTASMMVLVVLNCYYTQKLATVYRYEYSPSRLEVIDAVERWVDSIENSESSYFRVSSNCPGNDELPWFDHGHFRKTSNWTGPVTLTDALWPQKSYRLNEKFLTNQQHQVFDIKCDVSTVSSKPPNQPT